MVSSWSVQVPLDAKLRSLSVGISCLKLWFHFWSSRLARTQFKPLLEYMLHCRWLEKLYYRQLLFKSGRPKQLTNQVGLQNVPELSQLTHKQNSWYYAIFYPQRPVWLTELANRPMLLGQPEQFWPLGPIHWL